MKQSRALRHFPQIAWRRGKRYLWNPVQKKALENRPEERVRLRLIDYLIREAGWPQSRVGVEVASYRGNEDQPGRADIICYDKDFRPVLLVECKSEEVKLNQDTLQQAGSYNREIASDYVMVTNGFEEYLYKTDDPYTEIEELPVEWKSKEDEAGYDFDYWAGRGFAGKGGTPWLRQFSGQVLEQMFLTEIDNDPLAVTYLKPRLTSPDGPLNHYYRILHYDDQWRVALSMIASPHGSTRLVMMLKNGDQNAGLIEINPELHRRQVGPDSVIYGPGRKAPVNLFDHVTLPLNPQDITSTQDLIAPVITYFNQHPTIHA